MLELVIEGLVAVALILLGYVRPGGRTAVAAALLPVVWAAVTGNLSTQDDEGFDNWTIVILPFLCVASAGLCGVGVLIRIRAERIRAKR